MFTISYEDVETYKAGDIITFEGKRYRLLKKTTTAVSVARYYWWDALLDKLTKKKDIDESI